MTRSRGARLWRTNNRAATLYSVGRMTRTMMQSCASAAKLRGGGPILHNGMKTMAFMPLCRMGPPPRSFAADAQDCIMVRVMRPTEYKVAARLFVRHKRAPLDLVIPTTTSVLSCSELSRCGLASPGHEEISERRPTLTAPARDSV